MKTVPAQIYERWYCRGCHAYVQLGPVDRPMNSVYRGALISIHMRTVHPK